MRFRKTKAEVENLASLDLQIEAALKSINKKKPDGSAANSDATIGRSRGRLTKLRKEREALEATIEARRIEQVGGENLEWAQAEYASATAEELRAAFNEMRTEGHDFDKAKAWLQQRMSDLRDAAERAEEQQAAQEQAAKDGQKKLDDAAGERATAEILKQANERLTKPMALESRARLQARFKELAAAARKYAKTAEGFDSTGASRKAVSLKIAATFDELVDRLEIFRYDLDEEPSREAMEKRSAFYMMGCDVENFAFRSADGRPTQEQCLLKHAVARYFEEHGLGDFVSTLPKLPAPVHIPGPTQESLSHILLVEEEKLRSRPWREEQARKRVRELERIRIEDPKRYKELIAAAEPIIEQPEPETVYRVETATVESPQSLPKFYWPNGTVCVPGRDILWMSSIRRYVLPPEPADPWPNESHQRMEWVQDIKGEWVQQPMEVAAGSKWTQDAAGHWQEVKNRATGFLTIPGLVQIEEADHMPSPGDDRTEFRFGHFYTKQQVAEAEATTSFSLPAPPQEDQLPTVLDSAPELASRPETVWTRRELQLTHKGE